MSGKVKACEVVTGYINQCKKRKGISAIITNKGRKDTWNNGGLAGGSKKDTRTGHKALTE